MVLAPRSTRCGGGDVRRVDEASLFGMKRSLESDGAGAKTLMNPKMYKVKAHVVFALQGIAKKYDRLKQGRFPQSTRDVRHTPLCLAHGLNYNDTRERPRFPKIDRAFTNILRRLSERLLREISWTTCSRIFVIGVVAGSIKTVDVYAPVVLVTIRDWRAMLLELRTSESSHSDMRT